MRETIIKFIESWRDQEGNVNSTQAIINWVQKLNDTIEVNIHKIGLGESAIWFYDEKEGEIRNQDKSFFSIRGLEEYDSNTNTIVEQPIIYQPEIGYLGIICKEIDGVINFLMQAKIEPGNINKIQISPTIQATKSNYTQKHGGKKPAYLEYFVEPQHCKIIVDQIQSEQSSRFYKKRNRNMIIKIDDDIEVLPNYKWMTLGQIKALMRIDNLVNMDTRTVLSCIPFSQIDFSDAELYYIKSIFKDKALYESMFAQKKQLELSKIFGPINDYKMSAHKQTFFKDLYDLKDWHMQEREYICNSKANFKVIFCDISIEGREVKHWTQPLFEAEGKATFGLMTCNDNGIKKFLVKVTPEIGCFDGVEIGPSVQLEAHYDINMLDRVGKLFMKKLEEHKEIKFDTLLSEEGGRFYYEQNRNVIMEINKEELEDLPKEYFWVDYNTLNTLIQINNCLNIQLRNLLSILEI